MKETSDKSSLIKDLTERLQDKQKADHKIMGNLWFEKDGVTHQTYINIMTDPVYGSIEIDQNFSKLLEHGVVRRLEYVKQLPFVVIESANVTHTRLAHSLGVAKLAETAIRKMLERDCIYVKDSDEVENFDLRNEEKKDFVFLAKVCGLLHDIGHAPFGHTLDRLASFREARSCGDRPDKYFSALYVKEYLCYLLEEIGVDPGTVAQIFCPKFSMKLKECAYTKYMTLLKNVIDSDLDVDRMDYLVRDSFMSGSLLGSINSTALVECMRPIKTLEENQAIYALAYDSSAVPLIEHAIYGRLAMYDNCYETDIRLSCETMLVYCVKDFLSLNPVTKIVALIKYGDDDLLYHILVSSRSDSAAYQLAKALRLRRRYNLIFSLHADSEMRGGPCKPLDDYLIDIRDGRITGSPSRLEEWRNEIIQGVLSEEEKYKMLIYVTPPDRFEGSGMVNIYILTRKDGVNEVEKLHRYLPRVSDIIRDYTKSMPRLRIFASPSLGQSESKALKCNCQTFFKVEQGKKEEKER